MILAFEVKRTEAALVPSGDYAADARLVSKGLLTRVLVQKNTNFIKNLTILTAF
jgi:hypothetical protein